MAFRSLEQNFRVRELASELRLALGPRTECWESGTPTRDLTVEPCQRALGLNLELSYGTRDEDVNLESGGSQAVLRSALPSTHKARSRAKSRDVFHGHDWGDDSGICRVQARDAASTSGDAWDATPPLVRPTADRESLSSECQGCEG